MMQVLERPAHFLSVLLHPLWMPLYTTCVLLWCEPRMLGFVPAGTTPILLGMVALMTIGFPLTSILLLRRAGLISDLRIPDRQERIAPFALTALYLGMTYYLVRQTPVATELRSLFMAVFVTAVLALLITSAWKISVHMIGIGGMLGAVAAIAGWNSAALLPVIAFLVILAGMLGSARLISGQHGSAEVYAGTALGFTCTYFTVAMGWVL